MCRPVIKSRLNTSLLSWIVPMLIAIAIGGCATRPVPVRVAQEVLGKNQHFTVILTQSDETYANLAARYLGDAALAWRIGEYNNYRPLAPRTPVIIPLADLNTTGVTRAGFQQVPILCYHRFTQSSSPDKLEVTAAQFDSQISFLIQNGYTIVPLADFSAFIRGQKQLPRKSVVITIDDGYRSIYSIAFPIIRRHKIPVTAFIYTDFIGSSAALTWPQVRELQESGLVSFQSHSKSHSNMMAAAKGESSNAYTQRIGIELESSKSIIAKQTGRAVSFIAYPYGGANAYVAERTEATGYDSAATVIRGTNPAFAPLFLLRREMIFGSDTLAVFAKRLGAFVKGR
jgi:peptidoglycan/xylan/chitin deacetylase (PgdA/CDA1 family)